MIVRSARIIPGDYYCRTVHGTRLTFLIDETISYRG